MCVYVSLSLSIYLSISIYPSLSLNLSIYLSISLSLFIYLSLSIHLSPSPSPSLSLSFPFLEKSSLSIKMLERTRKNNTIHSSCSKFDAIFKWLRRNNRKCDQPTHFLNCHCRLLVSYWVSFLYVLMNQTFYWASPVNHFCRLLIRPDEGERKKEAKPN